MQQQLLIKLKVQHMKVVEALVFGMYFVSKKVKFLKDKQVR